MIKFIYLIMYTISKIIQFIGYLIYNTFKLLLKIIGIIIIIIITPLVMVLKRIIDKEELTIEELKEIIILIIKGDN